MGFMDWFAKRLIDRMTPKERYDLASTAITEMISSMTPEERRDMITRLVTARRPTPGRLGLALTAVGRRSLSAYLWQSIIMAPLLAAWGLGLGQHVNTAGVLAIATATWLAGLGLCVWLDARQQAGPFEVLLRRLVNRGRPAVPPAWGGPAPHAGAGAPGSR